ncbi:hypothetical protein BH24CHL4_BH24CHL4_18500 [soil metagenome]
MAGEPQSQKTYLWCDACRRSFTHADAPGAICLICSSPMRTMGKMSAILRGIMATEMVASDLRSKHRQLVRMIWTRKGRGEQYFRVLEPELTYSKFETRVTDLVCRGLEEGWIELTLPKAPSTEESDYRMSFADEERFVEELHQLVESSRKMKKP